MTIKQNGNVLFQGTRTKKFIESLDNTKIVAVQGTDTYGIKIEKTIQSVLTGMVKGLRGG